MNTTCLHCNTRPLAPRKNAASCGDPECVRKARSYGRDPDKHRAKMRERAARLRAEGAEVAHMEDRACEACGCTYRVEVRLPQRYCSQKCNASQQDMRSKGILGGQTARTFTCKTCGRDFRATGRPLFCSPLCSYLDRYNPSCEVVRSTCRTCGRTILWHSTRTYCSITCKRNRPQRWRKHALAVHERDQWTCQLCGTPTLREWVKGDMRSPTLDHIMPRSLGGSDDIGNLRTAHWLCNSIRGNQAETHAVAPTW